MMIFTKAERKKSKLRLALCGVSGSGKTTAALQIARGLGGRTALIETESGSASLYADQFDFDELELEAPYTPERYTQAIEAAEQQGYDNVIIDSMSHEWVGTGGCLEINDLLGKTVFKGNSFGAWSNTLPRHRKFLDKIVSSKIHVIATVRMKSEHVQDIKTKKVNKVGMKYEQKEDFEFEFTSVFNIDREGHYAITSKDRTSMFGDEPFVIDSNTGVQLLEWLNSGKNFYMSDENLLSLNKLLKQLDDETQGKVRSKYPNFADEHDTRFDEIKNGLNTLVNRMNAQIEVEAQAAAEQEALDNQPAVTDTDDDFEEDIGLTALGNLNPSETQNG